MKYIFCLFLLLASVAQSKERGAYAFYDYDSLSYVIGYNHREIRSIASITKLFTANIIIQSGVNLDEKIKVNGRSRGFVPSGTYISRIDLMRAMIISSDNRAAETLANHHPGGFAKFIEDANNYNDQHQLYDTKIVDSTGLLPGNVSSARDLIEFIHQIKNNPVIRTIANERNAVVNVPSGRRMFSINLKNTNPDIFVYDNVLISKTGFTSAAGRCVLMLVEKNRQQFVIIVLGQSTPKERSKVVNSLITMEILEAPKPKIDGNVIYEQNNIF